MTSMETEGVDPLVKDFYGSVILLSLLNPLENAKRPQGHLQADGKTSVNACRCFLDDLSFLVDYQPAGRTVTAIAGEQMEPGTVFWVATTQSDTAETLRRINWILKMLHDTHLDVSHKAEHLSVRIAAASIEMSTAKVENYRNIMTRVTDKAISSNAQPRSDLGKHCLQELRTARCTKLTDILFLDESLFRDLNRLIESPQSDYEGCNLAYHFRYTRSMNHLKSKCTGTFRPELWSLVRHYIGRLGFWFKASKRVVEYCQERPLFLKDFRVKKCPNAPAMMRPGVGVSTKLQDVLRRMLPDYDGVRVAQTLQSGQAPEAAKVSEQYANKSSARFRPRMHAEVALLEHFYERNLRYLGDDKYIGCSKASCYCCNLYFKYHPAGVVPRPCHGTVWPKWSIPTSAIEGAGSLPRRAIIRGMIDSMTTDLTSYVVARPHHRRKPPDSTTEISSRSSHSRT